MENLVKLGIKLSPLPACLVRQAFIPPRLSRGESGGEFIPKCLYHPSFETLRQLVKRSALVLKLQKRLRRPNHATGDSPV